MLHSSLNEKQEYCVPYTIAKQYNIYITDNCTKQNVPSYKRLQVKQKYEVTNVCKKNKSIKLQTFVSKTKVWSYKRL